MLPNAEALTEGNFVQEQIIGLLNPVLSLVYAAGFLLLWWRQRSLRASLAMAIAHCCVALAFLNAFLISGAYTFPSVLLPQAFFLGSSVLIGWAACERVGQDAPLKAYAVVSLFAMGLIGMAAKTEHFISLLYLINISHTLLFALTAQTLARAAPRHFLDRALVWIMAVLAAQFVLRPALVVMLEPGLNPETFAQSAYFGMLIVTMALGSMLLSTLMIAAFMLDQFRSREAKTKTDSLTGLKIRRAFEESSVELLDNALDRKIPVSIIVADIDHFKQVNDIWGHQAGDLAIANFGKLVTRMTRSSDLAGRIGGEEFCILVWNCHLDAAERLAERIRLAFATMVHEGISEDVRLTASFGVAGWNEGEGYGKMFARADAALYSAKSGGRDRVVSELERAGSSPVKAKENILPPVALPPAKAGLKSA